MINPHDPAFAHEGVEIFIKNKPGLISIDELVTMKKRHEGLTKREWFSGLALQGILGTRNHSVYYASPSSDQDIINSDTRNAVRIADALIAQLNKLDCPSNK